jgi:NADPH:quinone reductase-like Zn-dependent oxidoreductase
MVMTESPELRTQSPEDAQPANATMKAVVHDRYGIDAVEVREVARPVIEDDQVRGRVHASSVNPVEWYGVTGMLIGRLAGGGIRRPTDPRIGADLAGRVEAIGKQVTEFQVGDEVFGSSGGSWAEYVAAREVRLARKPATVSFEEAGSVAVAGMTALQAVRDHGRVQPGQKVLINGAAGGVGTFAVQIAKVFGAEVTAVCSTKNVDQTLALGADRVCDYTREDFTKLREKHDVMLDVVGSRSFLAFRRVLTPDATVVAIGAPMSSKGILGPLKHIIGTRVLALGRSQKIVNFIAKIRSEDLAVMGELMAAGKVRAVIDRRYDLSQAADALRYLGTTHARGKIVITM